MPADTVLSEEISTYGEMRKSLETDHMGEWVLIHKREVISLFPNLEEAAEAAVERFGRGPYLIRQIGAPPMTLPASVTYFPVNGKDDMRVR